MSTSVNFGGALKPFVSRIQNSDGTSLVTLLTAGTDPQKVSALSVSSIDTADKVVFFYLTVSGVDYLICAMTVQANSGNLASTPPVNALMHNNWTLFEYDAAGNKFFTVPGSASLKAAVSVTVTSAKIIAFAGNAQEFS